MGWVLPWAADGLNLANHELPFGSQNLNNRSLCGLGEPPASQSSELQQLVVEKTRCALEQSQAGVWQCRAILALLLFQWYFLLARRHPLDIDRQWAEAVIMRSLCSEEGEMAIEAAQ
jgi:hypothetical protein